jgi:hypothetical protein
MSTLEQTNLGGGSRSTKSSDTTMSSRCPKFMHPVSKNPCQLLDELSLPVEAMTWMRRRPSFFFNYLDQV